MKGRLKITKWNAKTILANGPRIMKEYSVHIGAQAQEEMLTEQFYWPVDTKRKSGAFIKKGERDIYDTGELIQSQSELVRGNTISLNYGAPYAYDVFKGENNMPARDWITPALKNKPLLPFLVERWNKINKP
jgi:hypothetical protein